MNYLLYNQVYRHRHLGVKKSSEIFAEVLLKLIRQAEKPMDEALRASDRFEGLRRKTSSLGQAGAIARQHDRGGLVPPAEMVNLRSGVNNIVCMQPFGCLPNHRRQGMS